MSKKFIYEEVNIRDEKELVNHYPLCMISGKMINNSVKGKNCKHIQGFSKIFLCKFLSEHKVFSCCCGEDLKLDNLINCCYEENVNTSYVFIKNDKDYIDVSIGHFFEVELKANIYKFKAIICNIINFTNYEFTIPNDEFITFYYTNFYNKLTDIDLYIDYFKLISSAILIITEDLEFLNNKISYFEKQSIPIRVILISSYKDNKIIKGEYITIDKNNLTYKIESNINMTINLKADKNIFHNLTELIKCYSSELSIFYNESKDLIDFITFMSIIKLNHLENDETINSKLCEIKTDIDRINESEFIIKIKLY